MSEGAYILFYMRYIQAEILHNYSPSFHPILFRKMLLLSTLLYVLSSLSALLTFQKCLFLRSCPRPQRAFYENGIWQQLPISARQCPSRTQKPSRHRQSKSSSHFIGLEPSLDCKPENGTGLTNLVSGVPRTANGNITRVMEFSDATSSDWSLFTSSDEASFTTESTRDSFSTVDYADACNLDTFSSIFSNLYAPESSSQSTLCSRTFSNSRPQARFISEERGYILNSYLSTQAPEDGKERISSRSVISQLNSTMSVKY